jgi:glutamate transport system permease protein
VKVWIGTLIGSTLASVIGIVDLTAQGSFLNSRYAGGLGVFASIAAVHVVIASGSGSIAGALDRRVAVQRRARTGLFDERVRTVAVASGS